MAKSPLSNASCDLARQNVAEGGRPFATVIVKDGFLDHHAATGRLLRR
ncbi:hypothetical protein [Kitasatospora cathayae]|uniref:DUF397 domain-containing protein n=1 Tax=Kitasatospora cathayae TaxID=3004092 RepID=A0ABY7QGM2_9ACTN|nr:hypothetical protein [Kitasatospora sp. HUAS 3-15]WBP91907.1 hypothetical protein O1G21_02295 [Kitasatospora sp. HUAS 3-15]